MFNSIGIIQRDAPTQGHTPQFQATQSQLASDFVSAIREMKRIISQDLPGLYSDTNLDEEIDLDAARQSLRQKIEALNGLIQEKESNRDQLQLLFDDIFSATQS